MVLTDFRAPVVTAISACLAKARMRPAAHVEPEGHDGPQDVAPRLPSWSAD